MIWLIVIPFVIGILIGRWSYKYELRSLHQMQLRIRTIQHGGKPRKRRRR